MFKQYGKPSAALIRQKNSFFNENSQHLHKQRKISNIYKAQALRKYCKNCGKNLAENVDFTKDSIDYKICTVCSHLNGAFEDSDTFCKTIYAEDDGKSYAENYDTNDINDFNFRVASIYIPKAEFLVTSLKNDDIDPNEFSYLDFGSGTGYFTAALSRMGLTNVKGSEVSKYQVDRGNKMMNESLLRVHKIEDTNKILSQSKVNVLSLIGVLEHLQDPREALKCIVENKNIEYLYLSVPIFSLSVYIEMLSNDIFHRQLHGGHTHLYTEESLNYLSDEFGFDIISEWWFGTDMVDLYRTIFINLENKKVSTLIKNNYSKMMNAMIDSMQLEIDKKHYSSEVHMLLKKRK